ncbi:peptidoglycan DD-metalloendopeptidase family protein [Enterovirga sp.]|uniref:peptidoglycan DD-metalloendopeptidase family protein n=1 Tax=Enterovirga sp. TaxID=2026350 RepID=UPI00262559E3|nr:peptidoglycan DD-metalloendopeptidase family protein [Enterovirga sp.]
MRAASRIALIGVVGSLAAACSTDSVRFAENPFSNPFAASGAGTGAEPSMTGSVDEPGPAPAPRAPSETVRAEPLAPVRTAALPTPSSPSPAPSRTASGKAGWSAAGGTTITVGSADSLSSISDRYGVPGSAILAANGITAGQVTGGRRVVIPVYSADGGGTAAPTRTVEAPRPGRLAASPELSRPVAEPPRKVADAAESKSRVRPGPPAQVLALPKQAAAKAPEPVKSAAAKPKAPEPVKTAAARPAVDAKTTVKATPAPAKVVAAAKPAPEPAAKPVKTAQKPEPQKVAAVAAPKSEPAKPSREPESTGALPSAAPAAPAPAAPTADFRWPARGRVITGFGGSGSNEGINIAVPDGTPVKAAGDGVVAYAGNEVKGYGNLVLIRHDNGYVSAYAHNSDLDVKRGQKVTRGQTIAKAGQTGNVTSPQLHFEIRKGSTPVDPMRYLASAQ